MFGCSHILLNIGCMKICEIAYIPWLKIMPYLPFFRWTVRSTLLQPFRIHVVHHHHVLSLLTHYLSIFEKNGRAFLLFGRESARSYSYMAPEVTVQVSSISGSMQTASSANFNVASEKCPRGKPPTTTTGLFSRTSFKMASSNVQGVRFY